MRGIRQELDFADAQTQAMLIRFGVLPATLKSPRRGLNESLCEWLIRCWQHAAWPQTNSQQKRIARLVAALKVLDPRSSVLCKWLPIRAAVGNDQNAGRVLFAPLGWPDVEWLAIVSSRLQRSLDFEQAWLAALRDSVLTAAKRGQALLAVEGTTAERFVGRAGVVLDVPSVHLHVGAACNTALWFESVLTDFVMHSLTCGQSPVYVSPRLITSSTRDSDADDVPERDRLLIDMADDCVALAVRSRGHCWQLLSERLHDSSSSRVSIVHDDRLTRNAKTCELLSAGARLLKPSRGNNNNQSLAEMTQMTRAPFTPTHNVSQNNAEAESLFLTHWTRGLESLALRDMPDELLDEWLVQPDAVDRTAWASLQRLLDSGRITARRQTATDSIPVVCFSATPLTELLRQRTYRPHRTRWDAEPFGLCVRQEALQRLGARPVIYGDNTVREALPANERHWFQPRISRTRTGEIDWSSEREWRLPGDLRLEWLAPEDVVVFVRSHSDAERLRCPWPIRVVESIAQSVENDCV